MVWNNIWAAGYKAWDTSLTLEVTGKAAKGVAETARPDSTARLGISAAPPDLQNRLILSPETEHSEKPQAPFTHRQSIAALFQPVGTPDQGTAFRKGITSEGTRGPEH